MSTECLKTNQLRNRTQRETENRTTKTQKKKAQTIEMLRTGAFAVVPLLAKIVRDRLCPITKGKVDNRIRLLNVSVFYGDSFYRSRWMCQKDVAK